MDWMVADSGGHIDLLVLSGSKQADTDPQTVTISQYSAAGGALQRVLYRHDYASHHLYFTMSSFVGDPSGRYLLLGLAFYRGVPGQTFSSAFTEVGWIHNGSIRALKSDGNWLTEVGW